MDGPDRPPSHGKNPTSTGVEPLTYTLAALQPAETNTGATESMRYDQFSRTGSRPLYSADNGDSNGYEQNDMLRNESVAELPMMPSVEEEDDDAEGGRFQVNAIKFDDDGVFEDFKPIFDYDTARDPDEDALMEGVYSVPTTPGGPPTRQGTAASNRASAKTFTRPIAVDEKNDIEASMDLLL